MPSAFSLTRSDCRNLTDPALRQEIRSLTGSEAATTRVLSSLERYGGDASIDRFEVIPKQRGRLRSNPDGVAWTVRAVRD